MSTDEQGTERIKFPTFPWFEMGREIAAIVGPESAEVIREAEGHFRLADALALCEGGDLDGPRAVAAL